MKTKVEEENKYYDINIGGLFCKPKIESPEESNLEKTRKDLLRVLNNRKNIALEIWDMEKLLGIKKEDRLDSLHCRYDDEKGMVGVSFHWQCPVIFKLAVKAGLELVDTYGRKQKLKTPMELFFAYNGMWFIELVDAKQFKSFGDLISSGPTARDILITILSRGKEFDLVIVPPCIIPQNIGLEVISGKEKTKEGKRTPKYIGAGNRGGDGPLILTYEKKNAEIKDRELVFILNDIFSEIDLVLSRFYTSKHSIDIISDEKEEVIKQYKNICKELNDYISIKWWDIFKKCIIASKLSKNVSKLQIKLVDNRLSQIGIWKHAEELDELNDRKGITNHIRKYLKECITERFEGGNVEYESLASTLSHIERMSSQHSVIVLWIVAIVAGLTGAIIGIWLG